MGTLISSFASWIADHFKFLAVIGPLITYLLGALANPQGAWNKLINSAIDVVDKIIPTVPEDYRIINMINSISEAYLPNFGSAIIYDALATLAGIAGIVVTVKVYKLIPFKAT